MVIRFNQLSLLAIVFLSLLVSFCSDQPPPLNFGKVDSVETYTIVQPEMSFKIEDLPTSGYSCNHEQSLKNKQHYVRLIVQSFNKYLQHALQLDYSILDVDETTVNKTNSHIPLILSSKAVEKQFNWLHTLSKVRVFKLANKDEFGYQFFNSDGSSTIEIGPYPSGSIVKMDKVQSNNALFHFVKPINIKLFYHSELGVSMNSINENGVIFRGEDYSNVAQVASSTQYFINQGRMSSDMSPIAFRMSVATKQTKMALPSQLVKRLDLSIVYELVEVK